MLKLGFAQIIYEKKNYFVFFDRQNSRAGEHSFSEFLSELFKEEKKKILVSVIIQGSWQNH